jgi:hypothetical protein
VTKYLTETISKEGRFILAHGFSSWSIGSIAFRPVVGKNIIEAGVCGGGGGSPHGRQEEGARNGEREREREREREVGHKI